MATIEHLQGDSVEGVVQEALGRFEGMDPTVLVAQQILLHGAINALKTVLERGCKPETEQAMLNDALLTLGMVHGVASKRGITLPKFELKVPVVH